MTANIQTVGDYYAIAPEIISTTPEPKPETVLNWAGMNFTEQHKFNRLKAAAVLEEFMQSTPYTMSFADALDKLRECWDA